MQCNVVMLTMVINLGVFLTIMCGSVAGKTLMMVAMLTMMTVVMLTKMMVVIALGRRVRVQRAAAKAVKSSSAVIEEAGGRWRRDYLMIGLDPSSPSDRLTSTAVQIL